MLKERNPILCILFAIITCGIYQLYWIVVTTNEIQATLRNPDGSVNSGGMVILFTILTCGFYSYYWWYKQGQRLAQLQQENGLPQTDNSTLFLILCLFQIGQIVNVILLQTELNKINANGGNNGNGGQYNNNNQNNNGLNGYNNNNANPYNNPNANPYNNPNSNPNNGGYNGYGNPNDNNNNGG